MSAWISRKRLVIYIAAFLCVLVASLAMLLMQEETTDPIDENNDGQIDTWVHRDADGRVTLIERDNNRDGQIDWRDTYTLDPATGETWLERTETDRDHDGMFETVAFYDSAGRMIRIERDRNGDGRADITSVLGDPGRPPLAVRRDDNFDGEFESTQTPATKTKP